MLPYVLHVTLLRCRDPRYAATCRPDERKHRAYAQHLNHWGTAEGLNPLEPLKIL
jgi:hypothetical protein